jgi:hypothetical protein
MISNKVFYTTKINKNLTLKSILRIIETNISNIKPFFRQL